MTITWLDDRKRQAVQDATVAGQPDPPPDRSGQITWKAQFPIEPEATIGQMFRRGVAEATGAAGAAYSLGPQFGIPARVGAGITGALGAKFLDEEVGGNVLPGEGPGPDMGDVYAGAGGAIVSPAKTAVGLGTRAALVRKPTEQVAKLFRQHGIDLTPGSVSDGWLAGFLEQKLKELPISGGITNARVDDMYRALGQAVDHLGDDATIRFGASAQQAGRRVAANADESAAAFGERSKALHRIASTLMPAGTEVPLSNMGRYLQEYAGKFPDGWEQMREVFGDSLMQKIVKAVEDRSVAPWEVIDQIRNQVGKKTVGHVATEAGDPGIAKGLYKAILDDMGAVASGTGKEVDQAWRTASRYHRKHIDYVNDHLRRLAQSDDPEKIFLAIQRGNVDELERMRKGMDPDTWMGVRDALIQKLGAGTPASRLVGDDVAGVAESFDPAQFVKNYNKLSKNSPEAVKVLFGRYTKNVKDYDELGRVITSKTSVAPDITGQVRDLAKIAERLKRPTKYTNWSGTAVALASIGSAGYMFAGGQGSLAATAVGAAALVGTARLWTNKSFLNWLLAGEKLSPRTKAFTDWVAAMPIMTGATILSAHDVDVVDRMRDALSEVNTGDMPSVPTGYNPSHERLMRGVRPGELGGQALPRV